ncbi:hypothetical protein CLOSTHATH_03355 [Hungatella hathewayi DSM 13479]|uniref:Uncharacterized protein n=1 Tax=Hungatella hathewayi DSM 13479 TaxID=566550 RepID=D3AIB5_9FIRM|nr:hypothetical protein CLOSTHATH_03355 [Hungatella hathewayi DSM 13479]
MLMNGHTVSSVVIFLCQIIDLNYDVCGDLEMKIPPKQILVIYHVYLRGIISHQEPAAPFFWNL